MQIQIRTSFDPLIRLPGGASLPPVEIRASRDKVYQNSDRIVFTGRGLIALDQRFRERVALVNLLPTPTRPGSIVDVMKVVRSVLAIAEARVSNAWTHSTTKWTRPASSS